MRRTVVVVLCLLFGVLVGLSLRPDDATPVTISHQGEVAAAVAGAFPATPLPRLVRASDILLVLRLAVGPVLAAAGLCLARRGRVATGGDPRPRSALVVHACPRRGPPRLI
jgi:hypothetical protein